MVIIDFLINWVLLPGIIIYGFVSWSKEHSDTKFFIDPDDNKEKETQKNENKKSSS
ncbi:MAG TPA: hypothetical protein IAC56_02405 [Candidatus Aphodousia faecigallinarum]|uniref:Uncharacterized protein n=1 Tax=Candidatus Aphodousia faecigallinarum TaxID=2840677 RepID=A0A9D1II14_9BURK|nr:hypothetical protein [Candidatus Aphodousia faecigallinarum]